MRTMMMLLVLVCAGCAAEGPAGLVNGCSPDADLVLGPDGAPTHGISACSICARIEGAYLARAAELGCTAPYPLDGCPIDEGQTDCLVWQVELAEADIAREGTCAAILAIAGDIEEYGGFECGDACTWTDPYAVPVSSDTVQADPLAVSGGWRDHHACAPGTPYAAR